MSRILIARFHSLGDVVLATGILNRLIGSGGEVVATTRKGYLPVFEGLAPSLVPSDRLSEIGRFSKVVDLQANATSRRLLAGLGPLRRARSRSAARRWVVFWGRRAPRPHIPHVVERYAEAAGFPDVRATSLRPRVLVTERDREEAKRSYPLAWERTQQACVALVPGGSRRMKRWPPGRFADLAVGLEREGLLGLRFEEPNAGEGELPGVVHASLRPLKGLLSRCRSVVTNDSGIMHLAVGLGLPVVALFGSTVTDFGFGPLGPADRLLEMDLACRPCAVHGARFCWQGHASCLSGIGIEEVRAAVLHSVGQGRGDGVE